MRHSSKFYYTNDGVKLHCLCAGEGRPLIMLPGGGFSANIFKHQIQEFSQFYQVFSLDYRGQGRSETVQFGYRISRFAKDLDDFITANNLLDVSIMCHSLGASILYNYIDLFGSEKIAKVIIIDEPPVLLINPIWSDEERIQYGAIYQADQLHQIVNCFTADNNEKFKKEVINSMTTPTATSELKNFIFECMDLPGYAAALLYLNNICQDFRDILKKLSLPSLLIAGKESTIPWQSFKWMSTQIPRSKLSIFNESEGGNHFLFIENPDKFNRIVLDFLQNEE